MCERSEKMGVRVDCLGRHDRCKRCSMCLKLSVWEDFSRSKQTKTYQWIQLLIELCFDGPSLARQFVCVVQRRIGSRYDRGSGMRLSIGSCSNQDPILRSFLQNRCKSVLDENRKQKSDEFPPTNAPKIGTHRTVSFCKTLVKHSLAPK